MTYPVRICFFTVGIEDMPTRKQRNPYDVARVLARHGRFSVFEATDNEVIAATMDWLHASGWFDFDTESCGYPWTKVALTEAGRTALGRGRTSAPASAAQTQAAPAIGDTRA